MSYKKRVVLILLRYIATTVFILSILISPLSAFILWSGLHGVPGFAFIAKITVINDLNETVFITPIVTYGAKYKGLMELYYDRPTWPVFRRTNIPLDPGEQRILNYDMDDEQFTEIVIKTKKWQKVFIADANPDPDNYTGPKIDLITIDSGLELTEPDQKIVDRMNQSDRYWIYLFLIYFPPIGMLASIPIYLISRRAYANSF